MLGVKLNGQLLPARDTATIFVAKKGGYAVRIAESMRSITVGARHHYWWMQKGVLILVVTRQAESSMTVSEGRLKYIMQFVSMCW